jgi:hypothetical protein
MQLDMATMIKDNPVFYAAGLGLVKETTPARVIILYR